MPADRALPLTGRWSLEWAAWVASGAATRAVDLLPVWSLQPLRLLWGLAVAAGPKLQRWPLRA